MKNVRMTYASTEQIALLDRALRACTLDEADAFVAQVAPLRPEHIDATAPVWARKQIAYWGGYFERDVRTRVEALYQQTHPVLGPASKDHTIDELLFLGMETSSEPFQYLLRPPPYPDEP